MADARRLTKMQMDFAEGVLSGKSQKQAFIDAGYSTTEEHAAVQASALASNPRVRAYLNLRRQEIQDFTNLKANEIIQEIARVGFSDIRDFVSWDETGVVFIPSEQLTKDQAAAVQSIKVRKRIVRREDGGETETIDTELKLHPKMDGLEKLMKHFGLYQQDRINDADRETHLLATVLWKFVMSMHLAQAIPLAEALKYAQQNPEEVQEWGREQKLLEPASASTN